MGVLLLLVVFFKIYLQYELECRLIFRGSWKGVVLCGKVYDSTLTKKEKKREQLRRSSDWLMGLLSEQQVVLWNELNGSSTVGSFTSVQNMTREMLPWMSIVMRGLKALSSLFSVSKLLWSYLALGGKPSGSFGCHRPMCLCYLLGECLATKTNRLKSLFHHIVTSSWLTWGKEATKSRLGSWLDEKNHSKN